MQTNSHRAYFQNFVSVKANYIKCAPMEFLECHYWTINYVFLEHVTYVTQLLVSSNNWAHGNLCLHKAKWVSYCSANKVTNNSHHLHIHSPHCKCSARDSSWPLLLHALLHKTWYVAIYRLQWLHLNLWFSIFMANHLVHTGAPKCLKPVLTAMSTWYCYLHSYYTYDTSHLVCTSDMTQL